MEREKIELKPCPFCGGKVKTFRYNGATQATCASELGDCAGAEIMCSASMWNRRALASQPEAAPAGVADGGTFWVIERKDADTWFGPKGVLLYLSKWSGEREHGNTRDIDCAKKFTSKQAAEEFIATVLLNDPAFKAAEHVMLSASPSPPVGERASAWYRGHKTPSTPHGPAEYDVDMIWGEDAPDGEGWKPLYAAPRIRHLKAQPVIVEEDDATPAPTDALAKAREALSNARVWLRAVNKTFTEEALPQMVQKGNLDIASEIDAALSLLQDNPPAPKGE